MFMEEASSPSKIIQFGMELIDISDRYDIIGLKVARKILWSKEVSLTCITLLIRYSLLMQECAHHSKIMQQPISLLEPRMCLHMNHPRS